CSMSLGGLGDDVIKVERHGGGADTRAWRPPWAVTESAYCLAPNHNKRSIARIVKHPEDQAPDRELARQSEVVVADFRAGSQERMGIGYEQHSQDNPALVWVTISGSGRRGPDADKPGSDFVVKGESGIMAITGDVDGEPMKVGVAIVDVTTALYAAIAALAA